MSPGFASDDGGRARYFTGKSARDCVVRAIAIATGEDYKAVYAALYAEIRYRAKTGRGLAARRMARGGGRSGTSPRCGVHRSVFAPYLERLGWSWVPLVRVGMAGPKPRCDDRRIPGGTVILAMGRHLAAMVDGTVRDAWDSSQRTVYGYWAPSSESGAG